MEIIKLVFFDGSVSLSVSEASLLLGVTVQNNKDWAARVGQSSPLLMYSIRVQNSGMSQRTMQ